eukprot:5531065-Pyramimonas_sp.AAC.3
MVRYLRQLRGRGLIETRRACLDTPYDGHLQGLLGFEVDAAACARNSSASRKSWAFVVAISGLSVHGHFLVTIVLMSYDLRPHKH